MVTLLEPSDTVIENSVFGVWKKLNISRRLIWACNRSNQLFRDEASFVELPTPDIVASTFLEENQQFHLAGCEISQYYNRLKAPSDIIPFPALRRLSASSINMRSASGSLVPCLTCIPMGATFPVAVAQSVTKKGLARRRLAGAIVL